MGIRTRIPSRKPSSVAVYDDTVKPLHDSDDRTQPRPPPVQVSPIKCFTGLKGPVASWILGMVGPAIELLDTTLSSVANLNLSGDFNSEISILAFEVAKTILKGYGLARSLSSDNIRFLKTSVLSSKGVKTLVSEDPDELLRIAAADMREELDGFVKEVAHFGNLCKDPQWHNLDRYFKNTNRELTWQEHLNADSALKQLITLVSHTADLLSGLFTLDKFEKEFYAKSLQEEHINLANLTAEIKSQRKIVKSLQKKSLWSKTFEEIIEKLVCIVHFLISTMNEAFGGSDGCETVESSKRNKKELGPMALHYATIITQIDTLTTLSSSAPSSSMRDTLYQRLPPSMRSDLPKKLQYFRADLDCNQIKALMDEIFHWLGPIVRNTTNFRALQGRGWSGGWANFKSEVNREVSGNARVLKIETLYHADRERTEAFVLELLVWLHHLIVGARSDSTVATASSSDPRDHWLIEMPVNVQESISKCGVSRSQNFTASRPGLSKITRLAKSGREPSPGGRKTEWDPVIDFDIDRAKVLDIIDGLERV